MRIHIGFLLFFIATIDVCYSDSNVLDSINYEIEYMNVYNKFIIELNQVRAENNGTYFGISDTCNKKTLLSSMYISNFLVCNIINRILEVDSLTITQVDSEELASIDDCVKKIIKLKIEKYGKKKNLIKNFDQTKCEIDDKNNCSLIKNLEKVIKKSFLYFDLVESESELAKEDLKYRNPAKYFYSYPGEGENTKIFDGFLMLNLSNVLSDLNIKYVAGNNYKIEINPFVQYSYNNTIEDTKKRKNLLKYGGKINIIYGIQSLFFKPRIRMNSSLNKAKNRIDSVNADQFSLYFTLGTEQNDLGFINLLLPRFEPFGFRTSRNFEIFASNYIFTYGREYSTNQTYTANIIPEFNIDNNVYKLNINLYLLQRVFEVGINYEWRTNYKNNLTKTIYDYNFKQYSVNINLLNNQSLFIKRLENKGIQLSVGFDYKEGENPWEGFSNQILREITIKFRF